MNGTFLPTLFVCQETTVNGSDAIDFQQQTIHTTRKILMLPANNDTKRKE